MIIETAKFGEIIVEEDKIIKFDSGLLAFEDLTRFVLFEILENSNFKWLQSIDKPQVAFLLVDPFVIKSDYYIELKDEFVEKLGISKPEDVLVYTIVTVPGSGFKDATTNLIGPLIINITNKNAKQIIFEKGDISIKYPLFMDSVKKINYGG